MKSDELIEKISRLSSEFSVKWENVLEPESQPQESDLLRLIIIASRLNENLVLLLKEKDEVIRYLNLEYDKLKEENLLLQQQVLKS